MLDKFYETCAGTQSWRAFRSEGYSDNAQVEGPDGAAVAMATLPPLLRTLLVTDGTVTKALEAYFWESVNVKVQHLNVVVAVKAIPWLNSLPGEEILIRQVELVGARSEQCYAKAFSGIKLAAFDPPLRQALVQGDVGIGVLLRESGLETYREIMAVGLEAQADAQGEAELFAYRTYRILREQKPVILIRESFPWNLYENSGGPGAPLLPAN